MNRNTKEKHHAGLPETKFGAKYLRKMRNKVRSVASTNNNLKYKYKLTIFEIPAISTGDAKIEVFPQGTKEARNFKVQVVFILQLYSTKGISEICLLIRKVKSEVLQKHQSAIKYSFIL